MFLFRFYLKYVIHIRLNKYFAKNIVENIWNTDTQNGALKLYLFINEGETHKNVKVKVTACKRVFLFLFFCYL